jgi:Cu-processing system permease protein
VTVVRLTLREAANRKVLIVGAVISVAFLLLFSLGFNVAFNQAADPTDPTDPAVASTILTVFGLYGVQFLAAFMAMLLASGAVAPEIDSGRLHAVLARPLSRTSWLAQRIGAFAVLAAMYIVVMSAAIIMIAAGIAGYRAIAPWRGIGLLALEVVVLVALGTALSVRFSAMATGVIVIALYAAAWIGGIMEFVASTFENTQLQRIAVGISVVIPSDALWRGGSYYLQSPAFLAAASLDNDTGNPLAGDTAPSILFIGWAAAYATCWWLLAKRWFRKRDL